MRRFQQYPIYINHPGHWMQALQQQREYFVDKGDYKMMMWLDYEGRQLLEITEDRRPTMASREYENQVYKLLLLIASTRVGKLLLDSLNPDVRFWIVPLFADHKAECKCGATTFPGSRKGGGGTRIYYNPTDWAGSEKKWKSADDILFHELVHAYRDGYVGYDGNNFTAMNEYTTAEEFFALHLQNVYLANRGATRFYRSYQSLQSVSKSTAYQYFAGDSEVLMAFRHFLDKDPLAAAVARWTHPPDSFNPWRDQPVLEQMYLKSANVGIRRLPAF